jgi:hypothetical protein
LVACKNNLLGKSSWNNISNHKSTKEHKLNLNNKSIEVSTQVDPKMNTNQRFTNDDWSDRQHEEWKTTLSNQTIQRQTNGRMTRISNHFSINAHEKDNFSIIIIF